MGAHAANSSDYEEYGYDPNGNMTSKRLRSGETISFTYDVLNRETVKDIPGGTAADVYSGYDLLGRKLFAKFVSTSGDGVVYTYDALARILSETSYGRALTFQYDLASNRTRITYPDSNYIQTTYDVLNRAQEVRENGATSGPGLLAVYAYDNLQRRTSVTFGNGTAETFAYDTDSRDWSLAQNLASTSQDVTLAFTLSPAPQILTRDLSNSAYGYTPPTLSKSYTANGLNQYTEVGGATFTNDARGNLTSDGNRTFAYDLENHLTSVSGSASMTLAYNPLGRLRETVSSGVTTQFLYDGDRLVAEYDGSDNLLRRYAHGPGVDEPLVWYEGSSLNDRRTHHADNQGSIIATSDGSGVGTIQTYGPYGEPTSWSGSRFKYTGQIAISEVSLYHYKARVYDPLIGSFLQTDPIGYEDDLNAYRYVKNDPINAADPTGLLCRYSFLSLSYSCTIDAWKSKDAERWANDPKNRERVAAMNQAYTDAVNKLNSGGDKKQTFQYFRNGRVYRVTMSPKDAASALASRWVVGDPLNEVVRPTDFARTVETRREDSSGRFYGYGVVTHLGRAAFDSSFSTNVLTFAHEAIHYSPQENRVFGFDTSGVLNDEDHGRYWDDFARRLLGRP